jgi:hypothetical protein
VTDISLLALTHPQILLALRPPPLLTRAEGKANALPRRVVVGAVDAMEDVDAVDNSKKFPNVT